MVICMTRIHRETLTDGIVGCRLGASPYLSRNARRHYLDHFGSFNQVVTVAGHKLILLDAPGLVEEDYRRHGLGRTYDQWNPLPDGAVQFVKSISLGMIYVLLVEY